MYPTAAVSGLYVSHPERHYFGVGRIEKDQIENYARRRFGTWPRLSGGWGRS